ncbi:MAG: hypothetical protein LBQ21_05805, partial [Clostridiales Family XIII bacterium]|nr:hypothetical protein [Clostridiales Family XIII bacterium]
RLTPPLRYAVRFSIAAEAAEKRQRSASPLSYAHFVRYAVRFSIAAEAAEKRQNETFWKAVHKAFHQFAMQIGKRY